MHCTGSERYGNGGGRPTATIEDVGALAGDVRFAGANRGCTLFISQIK